ncbi:protein FAM110A [Osmerus mordax]|uniref:protein FAM110A n=1 Tax=Osmerus mordax TaxID=8014 RepID=UPI0035108217
MSVDTLQPHLRRPLKAAAPPNRLPIKRPAVAAAAQPAGRKQTAVERLEADKAKYVKSQGALTKQQPIRPTTMCKPMLSPRTDLRPTRRTPLPCSSPQQGGAPLDLKHLSNLINGVNDVTLSPTTDDTEESQAPNFTPSSPTCPSPLSVRGEVGEGTPCSPCLDWSGTTKMKMQALGPVKGEPPGSAGSPTAATVRRVDVIPHSGPGLRTTSRLQQQVRQPLQPMPLHPHLPLNIVASRLRLLHLRTAPGSSPLKPVCGPPTHTVFPPAAALLSSDPLVLPPPSPAFTRQSSSSSRKRPSLTRSKSDMSDRFSRAGTDLERFFNLCGLDPTELQVLAGPASDIVSIARLRSASAPGSECAGTGREDEEEEEEVTERTPYGVSVIERNARVIKWLYGLRQAKDSARSTNM